MILPDENLLEMFRKEWKLVEADQEVLKNLYEKSSTKNIHLKKITDSLLDLDNYLKRNKRIHVYVRLGEIKKFWIDLVRLDMRIEHEIKKLSPDTNITKGVRGFSDIVHMLEVTKPFINVLLKNQSIHLNNSKELTKVILEYDFNKPINSDKYFKEIEEHCNDVLPSYITMYFIVLGLEDNRSLLDHLTKNIRR